MARVITSYSIHYTKLYEGELDLKGVAFTLAHYGRSAQKLQALYAERPPSGSLFEVYPERDLSQ